MTPSQRTPTQVLAAMLRADATRPRVTFYDDAAGERLDLSGRVLATWVAKAGSLLQDDLDGAPSTTVGIDLPVHWRALYWALATWAVGATVVVGPEATTADVLVTGDPQTAARESGNALVVLVTPAMLARSSPVPVADVVDEARDLATYPDTFEPLEEPSARDAALVTGQGTTPYGDLVPADPLPAATRVLLPDDLPGALRTALRAWAADGSVVIVRPGGDGAGRLQDRIATEGVTLDLSGDAP